MRKLVVPALVLGVVVLFASCNKYEAPEFSVPSYNGPAANKTIQDIKNAYDGDKNTWDSIVSAKDPDFIVDAVVVSSDEGGNFYKSIVLQDETGAIEMQISESGLYTQFAVGQKVYVNCKGLCVDVYGQKKSGVEYGIFRLGWVYREQVGQINANAIGQYIQKDGLPSPANLDTLVVDAANAAMVEASVSLFNDPNVSRLVTLKNVVFDPSLVGKPLSEELNTTDRALVEIDGRAVTKFVVRTSNYSKIRGIKIPEGPCTLTGILAKYGQTYQLELRTPEDIVY